MMLWLLLEAALRSLLLGAIVGLGLKLTRVRDPRAHMTAWTGVLIASLAMPAMMHWLVVTVPSSAPPLQLVEMIEAAPNTLWRPVAESFDLSRPAQPETASPSVTNTDPVRTASYSERQPARAARINWFAVATGLYVAVTAVLLLRLCIGLVLTWRLARAAAPIGADWTGASCGSDTDSTVRVSDIVGMPVTFGSTILLPRECVEWDQTKCEAVLTHERAHIAHGDFYILLLAMLNRALFWFSPFAWWQVKRLAELAEMISDDAAIEVLADRPSYADILIEFAGDAPRAPAGLAMARANTVRQRVERILAAKGLPMRTGWRQQVLIAAVLVPLTAICAGTIARGTVPVAAAPGADPTGYDPYAGWYRLNPLHAIAVTRDGERLFGQVTGGPRFELTPQEENNRFTFANGNASITFISDADAPARELLMQDRRFGERHASRIDPGQGQELGELFARRIASAPERFMDQAPAPGSKAALLQIISDLQHGGAIATQIGAPLAERLRQETPPLQDTLATLGAVESIFFRGVGPGGYDIYGVKFANGSAEFRLLMGPGRVTEDVTFRPDGDATPGGILACAQEPTLKSAPSAAPIKLLLFNASGVDIHLYGLDAQGQRSRHLALVDNRTVPIMTHVGNAWIATDAAGRCREIVVAGQHTRFVSLRHAGSGEEPDRFASRRSAPTPGSEDALLAHIDALARGKPDYSHMTPEAAGVTRREAELDRAILAKLGAVRAVSFRGVTPFDSDIYVVHFAAGSAEWRIALANDGRIGRIALGPQY
jgi:beta-lactamase regulating signal transducer with metallopeptidase domain